jgi:hypothetical protein
MPATSCLDSRDNSARNNRSPSATHHLAPGPSLRGRPQGKRSAVAIQCLGLQRLQTRKACNPEKRCKSDYWLHFLWLLRLPRMAASWSRRMTDEEVRNELHDSPTGIAECVLTSAEFRGSTSRTSNQPQHDEPEFWQPGDCKKFS